MYYIEQCNKTKGQWWRLHEAYTTRAEAAKALEQRFGGPFTGSRIVRVKVDRKDKAA